MKYTYKSITTALMAVLTMAFAACSKDNNPQTENESEMKSEIHIVGHTHDKGHTYWIDGVATMFSESTRAYTQTTLQAHNDDIYAFGSSDGDETYWKNGIEADLTADRDRYKIISMTVYAGDIYKLGHKKDNNSEYLYWKNNEEPKTLSRPENTLNYKAYEIVVAAGKVYVRGDFSPNVGYHDFDVIWEDGKITEFTEDIESFYLQKIVNVGDELCVLGAKDAEHNIVGVVWTKSKGLTILEDSERNHLSNVAIHGKDIYVVGSSTSNNADRAVYWKNGKKVWSAESDTPSHGSGIAVDGEDVYVVGENNGKAMLWKNGVATTLSENGADAHDILIKKVPVVK